MAKRFPAAVFLGALLVGACWVGASFPGAQADRKQAAPPISSAGVRSPSGDLVVYYKLKGAGNVAHLEGVTAIDFAPGCVVIQYKQGQVHRGQVLFTDRTEDLHWLPAPEKR